MAGEEDIREIGIDSELEPERGHVHESREPGVGGQHDLAERRPGEMLGNGDVEVNRHLKVTSATE